MYNIGDLVIYKPLNRIYTGLIIDAVKDKHWWGGGYYVFLWQYPEHYGTIQDNKASFEQLSEWVQDKEAKVYPVKK